MSTPGKVTLPTEVLLIIRGWLFPTITAQLIKQSAVALVSYEQSLRDLLCPDCISYNLDIYGPDIWQWEQFSGAKTTPGAGILNPKQFADAEHWLESHLSRRRLYESNAVDLGSQQIRRLGQRRRPTSGTSWPPCFESLNAKLFANQRTERAAIATSEETSHEHASSLEVTQEELDGRAQITLHLVTRELGLIIEYEEAFGVYGRHIISPTRRLRWPSVSNSCYNGQGLVDVFQTLLRILVSLTAACLSAPITLTTVALTILCFYSRPRALRIL
ncbi:hypothetical protein BDZ97DRAFT_1758239 [Flammula alnicola]|nr:hypothetical protein BDZ97DRAFT_1758239 [Flammula alnicola]